MRSTWGASPRPTVSVAVPVISWPGFHEVVAGQVAVQVVPVRAAVSVEPSGSVQVSALMLAPESV